MKKIIPVIVIVVIAIIASLSLFFLVLEPQMKLTSVIGTYSRNDNSGSMQLNSDGSVFVQTQGNSAGVSGTWKFVNDNTVQVSFTLLGTPITTQYNFDGKQLVNTANNGNILTKGSSTNNNQLSSSTPTPTDSAKDLEKQSFVLQPNSQYTITLTAKQGYSWDSYDWVNGFSTALVSDTQSTLQINNDLKISADFASGDNGKGATATITVITANIPGPLNLETSVLHGTATVK